MERAILVHLSANKKHRLEAPDSMTELRGLAEAAGASVVSEIFQHRSEISPKFLIGRGKVDEIQKLGREVGADLVIFDHNLTPIQLRSLENEFDAKVIDRTQIILDIFAQRARSNEGKLQVELAQLNYLLPRLLGKGKVLSRLGGGIGTRGPGEKKLEEDRRRIQVRMTRIKKEIRKIQKRRSEQRRIRRRGPVPIVSLVGYTNAGKSTLFNSLSREKMLVSPMMFATLDPVIRRVNFKDGSFCFLTDTVGLIKELPKELKTAFKATLEELGEADCLCHVIDITSRRFEGQIKDVENILAELEITSLPIINVFNKIDLMPNGAKPVSGNSPSPDPAVYISAKTGEGIDRLKAELHNVLFKDHRLYHLSIPKSMEKVLDSFTKWSLVLKRRTIGENLELKIMAKPQAMVNYTPYLKRGEGNW
jgi:GTP-binding protein HflX